MSDPVIVNIKENAWRKVATAVTSGNIWMLQKEQKALFTYRMTGETAPTDSDEGMDFINPGMTISNDAAIDVYIMAIGDNGKVRVDV